MSLIQAKAEEIARRATPEGGLMRFDTAMVLVIIQAVTAILQAIKQCKQPVPPADVVARARSGGWHERSLVRKSLKAAMRNEGVYALVGPRLVNAALAVGGEATEAEAQQMFDEAG